MKYLLKIIAAEQIGGLYENDEIEGRVLTQAIAEPPTSVEVRRIWSGAPNSGMESTKRLRVKDFRAVRTISDDQFDKPVAIIYLAWVVAA